MNIEVRGETCVITGYVNAVERYSKPITDNLRGKVTTFVEKIKAGVFKNSLKRNDDVKVLLNHKQDRELATTKDGSAKLEEDNIGLRAEVIITDKEVVEKARNNKLVGWSFGFYSNAEEIGTEGEYATRTLTDIDLAEVSILDDTRKPAYYGTSIETRSEEGRRMEIREEVMTEETPKAKEGGVDIEALAELIAVKVVGMLSTPAEEKAEEETEEETSTTETEAETEAETETEEVAEEEATPEEEEETEQRAIDYTDFESRLASLN